MVTVFEFIGLLACSVLGGLLTGVCLVYMFLQCEKYRLHRARQNGEGDGDGDWVIDTSRQRSSPSLPIQDPPFGDTTPPSTCYSSLSFQEWRLYQNDRTQNLVVHGSRILTEYGNSNDGSDPHPLWPKLSLSTKAAMSIVHFADFGGKEQSQ